MCVSVCVAVRSVYLERGWAVDGGRSRITNKQKTEPVGSNTHRISATKIRSKQALTQTRAHALLFRYITYIKCARRGHRHQFQAPSPIEKRKSMAAKNPSVQFNLVSFTTHDAHSRINNNKRMALYGSLTMWGTSCIAKPSCVCADNTDGEIRSGAQSTHTSVVYIFRFLLWEQLFSGDLKNHNENFI